MRLLPYTIWLIVLLGLSSQSAHALDSKAIFQMHQDRVFQIRVLNRETGKKSSIGSGFIIGDGRQVATNYHVISRVILEPDLFYITYLAENGREGELELIALDIAHDLALLASEQFLGEAIKTSYLPPSGAPIFAMGNPLDLGLNIVVGTNGGILNQTDDSRILFSGSLNSGMSGGPTFNERGELIGINVATARNDISFIVPSKYLNDLLQRSKKSSFETGQDLKAEVTRQLIKYEKGYIEQILEQEWTSIKLRNLSLPGIISPTIRCWDNSARLNAAALYRRFQIRCANKNRVYLDSTHKFVGNLVYEYFWLESEQMNSLRFHNLYEKLNKDQIDSHLDEDAVRNSKPTCVGVNMSNTKVSAIYCSLRP